MIDHKELEAAQDTIARLQSELEGQYAELSRERAALTELRKAFQVLVNGVTKK